MRKKRSFFIVVFLFSLSPLSLFAEIRCFQNTSLIYYSTTGNVNNSFYPRNAVKYLQETIFSFKNFLPAKEIFGELHYRITDDQLIDPQQASLEKLFFGIRSNNIEFSIGDIYSSFSDYSLAAAVKGLKLEMRNEGNLFFGLLAGIETTSWEDFWEKRCEDSSLRKYLWGFKISKSFLNNRLRLSFNYGGSKDDSAYVSQSSDSMLINVCSIVSEYSLNEYINLSSEFAYSFSKKIFNSSVQRKSDKAFKGDLNFNFDIYNATFSYSRLAPHFYSAGGYSAQDLESICFNGILFIFKGIRLRHYIMFDRDNLKDLISTTTKQINPGVKFNFSFAGFDISLGEDVRKRYSVDKTTNSKTKSYSFFLGKDFNLFYGNLEYRKDSIKDKIDSNQNRKIDSISFSLDSSFSFKKVRSNWEIGVDFQREEYLEMKKADQHLLYNFGLRLEFPSLWIMELRAILGDDDYYQNEQDSNQTQYYFSLEKKIKENIAFLLKYEYKGYDYTDPNSDYSENVLTAKLSISF